MNISSLLGKKKICIVDVGAAGGLAKRWRAIDSILKVVAFEPDSRSNPINKKNTIIVNKAAASFEGSSTLYMTEKPRCSSLLMPNMNFIKRFPDPQRYQVIHEMKVQCTTVDLVLSHNNLDMDFIKLDTQGTELDILLGSKQSLSNCLGIEVEVQFQPLYINASTFDMIHQFINQFGFELYDLRRTAFMRRVDLPLPQKKGQLIFGDALYFRDWKSIEEDHHKLLKLAILLLTYGYADVVFEITENSQRLTAEEKLALNYFCMNLKQNRDIIATRKDTMVGTSFGID